MHIHDTILIFQVLFRNLSHTNIQIHLVSILLSVCVCGRTREGLRDGGHFPGERQAEDQVDQQRHAGFEDPEVEEPFVGPQDAVRPAVRGSEKKRQCDAESIRGKAKELG